MNLPSSCLNPRATTNTGFVCLCLVVSAYTPEGYINNVQHDFGSILRFIEFNFDLPIGGLNFADARAKTESRGLLRPWPPAAPVLPHQRTARRGLLYERQKGANRP